VFPLDREVVDAVRARDAAGGNHGHGTRYTIQALPSLEFRRGQPLAAAVAVEQPLAEKLGQSVAIRTGRARSLARSLCADTFSILRCGPAVAVPPLLACRCSVAVSRCCFPAVSLAVPLLVGNVHRHHARR
jgi:hypothetical protein